MKKKCIVYLIVSAMLVSNITSLNALAMEISEKSEVRGAEEQSQYNEFSDGDENEDENKEENSIEKTEIFSAQEDLMEQETTQNGAEGEEFSDQKEAEIRDGHLENAEAQFSSIESDIVEISAKSDGGYGYTVDSWLTSSGTRYSMDYLGSDVNFPNTAVVSLNDSKFGMKLTEVTSNLIYRGFDGWKELFF